MFHFDITRCPTGLPAALLRRTSIVVSNWLLYFLSFAMAFDDEKHTKSINVPNPVRL
jgi:hypothetical protein